MNIVGNWCSSVPNSSIIHRRQVLIHSLTLIWLYHELFAMAGPCSYSLHFRRISPRAHRSRHYFYPTSVRATLPFTLSANNLLDQCNPSDYVELTDITTGRLKKGHHTKILTVSGKKRYELTYNCYKGKVLFRSVNPNSFSQHSN